MSEQDNSKLLKKMSKELRAVFDLGASDYHALEDCKHVPLFGQAPKPEKKSEVWLGSSAAPSWPELKQKAAGSIIGASSTATESFSLTSQNPHEATNRPRSSHGSKVGHTQPTTTSTGGSGGGKTFKRCYEDHPGLSFTDKVSGVKMTVYGGSCGYPIHKDADIYVGFDHTMNFTGKQFPWVEGEEFRYLITDGQPPKELKRFNEMIKYVGAELRKGKKVHMGCIGGHGRTGLVFSVLVHYMTGMEDSTTYVRENYCKKAVESVSQVEWLHKHYGIKKVKGSKEWSGKSHQYGADYKGSIGLVGAKDEVIRHMDNKQTSIW